jgi:hypothetical protein
MLILPCFASTSARWSNPIPDARSPCRYATRKIVLSRFDFITLNSRRNSSCVRKLIVRSCLLPCSVRLGTTAADFRRPFELVREDFLAAFILHKIAEVWNAAKQPPRHSTRNWTSMTGIFLSQQFPLSVSASTVFWPFGHPLCSTAGLPAITSSKIARS